MKKKWNVILCIALAAVVLGGSLTVWRLCFPPDTDPDAPFRDLPNWEKKRIQAAVVKYYENWEPRVDVYWDSDSRYSLRYYGTIEGYHIIFSARPTVGQIYKIYRYYVAGCSFSYSAPFVLLAYKNGEVISLLDAYLNPFSKEQIQIIHQCWERFNKEVYWPMSNNK